MLPARCTSSTTRMTGRTQPGLAWREQHENLPITPAPNTHSFQNQAANTSFGDLFLAAFEKSRLASVVVCRGSRCQPTVPPADLSVTPVGVIIAPLAVSGRTVTRHRLDNAGGRAQRNT